MTPESFVQALDHLDPGSRALLDLSLHRGMEDREIAELLGSDPDYVSNSREAAIAQVADDLGLHGDGEAVRAALAEMGEDAWRPRLPDEEVPAPQVEEAPRERPKRSQRGLTLFVLLVVAAVAAAVVAAGGGSKSSSDNAAAPKPAPAAKAPSAAPAAKPVKPGAALEPLSPASRAKGTARLSGRSLSMTVAGLPQPQGSYEVWLYNDEIDSVPVASFRSGSATVTAKLPASAAGYRYLDVSQEPADGNPNHSGQSVLRVPLRSLP